MPILGQGTWEMGQKAAKRKEEIEALRLGIDLGMTLIDTAEYYDNEDLVGEAIGDKRKEVFLVSKVMPSHATRQGTIEACNNSLKRLKTPYLDLYLLHWRGNIPFEETLEGFRMLKKQGKILEYGVSNFDVSDMEEAIKLDKEIASNQVLYNLTSRGIEWDLLPWCEKQKITIMAYSPFGHDVSWLDNPVLKKMGPPAQVALAWLRQKGTVAIPKASNLQHVRDNRASLDLKLSPADLKALDEAFPSPRKKVPLEMI